MPRDTLPLDIPEAPARRELPPLRARSEDQQKFAAGVRPGMIAAAERVVQETSAFADLREQTGRADAAEKRAVARHWFEAYEALERIDDAGWWLDHRKDLPGDLLAAAVRELARPNA